MLSHTPLERAKARDELSEHIRHPRAANVLGKKKVSDHLLLLLQLSPA